MIARFNRAMRRRANLLLCTWLLAAAAEAQSIRPQIEALQARHGIPVVAYSVWQQGNPVESRVLGAAQDTPLRWGSITKTVTALTVLQLAAANRLRLEQSAAEITGMHWANAWQRTHPVTVLQLLELSAGFTDLSAAEFNYPEPITLQAALALDPAHRATRWPPGLQHSYSNLTPGLSQLVIEAVTRTPYATAVASHVFEPLGMTSSNFAPRSDLPGGFKADGTTPIPYWHMTFPAYGALNATLGDLERLLNGIMNGEHLAKATIARMMRPATSLAARRGFQFEYASGLYPRVRRGHVWRTHGGDADGYRSRLAFLPEQKSAYIVAINTDNPQTLRSLEAIFEDWLTADLDPPVAPPPVAQTNLHEWAGSYYPSSTRFAFERWSNGTLPLATVRVSSNQLRFTRRDREQALIALGDDQFRRPADPVATVAFVKDEFGHRFIQGELGNYAKVDDGHCPPFMQRICETLRK